MGLPKVKADLFLEHFDEDTNGVLEIEKFQRAVVHMLNTSIPGLLSIDMIALFACFVKQAADGQVSLSYLKVDPLQFLAITQDLSTSAFDFTG